MGPMPQLCIAPSDTRLVSGAFSTLSSQTHVHIHFRFRYRNNDAICMALAFSKPRLTGHEVMIMKGCERYLDLGFPEINVFVTVLSAGIAVPRAILPLPVASGYERSLLVAVCMLT